MVNKSVLIVIILAGVVTWIPRILPFILTQGKTLPPLVIRFLNYLPMTIIFALTLSSIVDERQGQIPSFFPKESLALLVTFGIVSKTKNILLAVVAGVLVTALLRAMF